MSLLGCLTESTNDDGWFLRINNFLFTFCLIISEIDKEMVMDGVSFSFHFVYISCLVKIVAFFIISFIFVFQRKIYGMMEWWNGGKRNRNRKNQRAKKALTEMMALIWSLALLRKWVKYDHFYSHPPLSTNNSGASFFARETMVDDTIMKNGFSKLNFWSKNQRKIFFVSMKWCREWGMFIQTPLLAKWFNVVK